MGKRWSSVVFLLLVGCLPLFAQMRRYGLPIFPAEVVRTFPVGEGTGAFGHGRPSHEINHPFGLNFDDAGNLYVSDLMNDRVVVFDQDFNWSRIVPTGRVFGFVYLHDFGIESDRRGPILWDMSGNLLFELDTQEITYKGRPLSGQTGTSRYVVLDDETVVMYLRNGDVVSFTNLTPDITDNANRLLTPAQTMARLHQIAPLHGISVGGSDALNFPPSGQFEPGTTTYDYALVYRDAKPIVRNPTIYFGLNNGRNSAQLSPSVVTDHRSTLTPLSQILTTRDAEASPLLRKGSIPARVFLRMLGASRFCGTDATGATYWYHNSRVLVFDSNNVFLDAFWFSPTQTSQLAVSPAGDLYYLVSRPDGHTLYRVVRRW